MSSRSAYESDRTLILFGRFKARITAEDETVLLQGYTQEFAVAAGTTRYGEKCCVARKSQQ
jgi:hypothetical protein